MKHIVVTRINFSDLIIFEKYYELMTKVYVPAINSQINKNFEVWFIINPDHISKINFKLNAPIRYFYSAEDLFNAVKDEKINIQTRHDCDDWMSYDYIDTIQSKYSEFIGEYDKFIIQSQIYKMEIDSGNLYKMCWEYEDKKNSMFVSLCQKVVENYIFEKKHSEMHLIANKVIDLGYDFTRLVIHENNKLSKVLKNEICVGDVNKKDLSIILPTFNNVEFIDECIDSLKRSCEGSNCEILIGVDNCKKTINHITKKYNLHDYNIRFYFFDKNVGPYIIKNSLIRRTNSDKILFFDSDDIIDKNAVKKIIDSLDNFDMVRFKFYNFQNNTVNFEISPKYADGVFGIQKNVFLSLNGYEPWVCGADSEMVWRVTKSEKKIKLIDECLFYRRRHGNNLTEKKETNERSKLRSEYRDIFAIKRANNNSKPLSKLFTHPYVKVSGSNIVFKENKKTNNLQNIDKKNIVILSTLWNASKQIPQYIESIKSQTFTNFKVIVIDDKSSDGSYELLLKLIGNDERFIVIKNEIQKFKTQNFYEIINNEELIKNDDIIVELDGDDSLNDSLVINRINEQFKDSSLWIAGYKWIDNNGKITPFFNSITNANNPRKSVWTFSAMRVFKAFLFRKIKKEDLMYQGEFIRAANDIAYGMPMLEMAGNEHFKNFKDITYKYNWHKNNTHTSESSVKNPSLQKLIENYIYSKKRYDKILTTQNNSQQEEVQKIVKLPIPKSNTNEKIKKITSYVNKNFKLKNESVIIKDDNKIDKVTTIVTDKEKEVYVDNTYNVSQKQIVNIPEKTELAKIKSNLILKPKEPVNLENHQIKSIDKKEKHKVLDESKIEQFNSRQKDISNIKNIINNPKITKPQNKIDINNRRREWEQIFISKS